MEHATNLGSAILKTLRERRMNAVLWAGISWLIVTMVGVAVSAVLVASLIGIPFALFTGIILIAIPIMFVSALWGWRSAIVAWVACAYSLIPAIGVAASGVQSGTTVNLVAALLVAGPGILSAFAAISLRGEALERSGRTDPR